LRFIGWDLTDPHARTPRAVDEARLDLGGRVAFDQRRWPGPTVDGGLAPEALVAAFPVGARDVVVVDGPHALARPGARVRESERLSRAPGRTPDELPAPGRPFSGFLRGSVLLFAALRARGGLPLLDVDAATVGEARLFEAFPGAVWRRLGAPRRGARKASREGREWRREALEAQGLTFPAGVLPTHDQLDAAACAWLGWLTRTAPWRVTAVGAPLTVDARGWLREGRILHLDAS